MATKKNDDELGVTQDLAVEVEEFAPGTGVVDKSGWVEVPNNTSRTVDRPAGNTTFADRAKAQGGNKRVDASESK